MADLRRQEDVWSHLMDLWSSVKQSKVMMLDVILMKQAVGVFFSLIDEEGVEVAEILAESLFQSAGLNIIQSAPVPVIFLAAACSIQTLDTR